MTDIVLVVLSIIMVSLLAGIMLIYIKSRKITIQFVQAELDKQLLLDRLEKVSEDLQALETQQSDGFLRFISQSRDWAFEYIEKVQDSIVELHSAMESSDEAKITKAYQKLLEYLPETNPDVVN